MKKYLSLITVLFISFAFAHTVSAVATDCGPGKLFDSKTGTSCSLVPPCQSGDVLDWKTGTLCPRVSAAPLDYNNRLIKKGDKDKALVTAIQEALKALGYTLNVDGSFGNATLGKVIAFQKSVGITRDGIIGPHTLQALERELNKKGNIGNALLGTVNRVLTSNRTLRAPTDFTKGIDLTKESSWGVPIVFDKQTGKGIVYKRSFGLDKNNGLENTVITYVDISKAP